jgi:proteic killer suppression protein
MIASFRHKGLRRFFENEDRSKLPAEMTERIARVLLALHTARALDDLAAVPSFRLHALHGDLKGYWAVTVRANWRIIFRVDGDDIVDVDLVDYH